MAVRPLNCISRPANHPDWTTAHIMDEDHWQGTGPRFRQRQLRYWRIATRVIDALLALALAAIIALFLKMILF